MSEKSKEQRRAEDKHNKQLKKKRDQKKKKKDQAASRERRGFLRRKIAPYYESYRDLEDKHLLFVLGDTANMERVLFQKHDLGKGITLLTLPYINEEMIQGYMASLPEGESAVTSLSSDNKDATNRLTSHFFGVKSNDIVDIPEGNIMVFRGCEMLGMRNDTIPLNVRPYNAYTWYNGEATTVGSYRVYSGAKLRTFFTDIDEKSDIGKTCVFHDSLTEILIYRALRGKLKMDDVREEHALYGTKGFLASASPTSILLLDTPELAELLKRFGNEKQETEELNRT